MELKVENGAILAYRRLSYRPWFAIAEFVDNSIDSYLREENRTLLDSEFAKKGEKLEVEILYLKDEDLLRIVDNSIGMSEEELSMALVIGTPPMRSAGLSEFGMGMKTSAIWFADRIEIRTKKLGETQAVSVVIDVQKFVSGERELEVRRSPKAPDDHYTHIELSGLKRRIGQSAFNKTTTFLGSIYREYLRDEVVHLVVNGGDVEPPPSRDDDAFMRRSDGSQLVIDIDVEVNGKRVTGWIGVLRSGFTGRANAGFTLLRNRRAVRAWVDSWRPEEIFGEARNDTKNQRITGELNLDSFRASHTKDAIDWEDDDEHELGEKLKKVCADFDLLREAVKKTSGRDRTEEGERERQEALDLLRGQMTDGRVTDVITILDVPTPELTRVQNQPLNEVLSSAEELGVEPVAIWKIGHERFARLYEVDLSVNDPYFEFEVMANRDLKIVVNSSHPALTLLDTAEGRLAHYHHVVIEALAEWHCAQQEAEIVPSSIRLMKDKLFRTVAEVEVD